MKKNNNNYSHDLKLTTDSLAYTSDEDLKNLHDSLRKERDMASRHGYQTLDVEISLCYVQREIDIRDIRKKHHYNYLSKNNLTLTANLEN